MDSGPYGSVNGASPLSSSPHETEYALMRSGSGLNDIHLLVAALRMLRSDPSVSPTAGGDRPESRTSDLKLCRVEARSAWMTRFEVIDWRREISAVLSRTVSNQYLLLVCGYRHSWCVPSADDAPDYLLTRLTVHYVTAGETTWGWRWMSVLIRRLSSMTQPELQHRWWASLPWSCQKYVYNNRCRATVQ